MKHLFWILLFLNNLSYGQQGEIISFKKLTGLNISGIPSYIRSIGGNVAIIDDLDKNGYPELITAVKDDNTLNGNLMVLFIENNIVTSHTLIGPNIGGFNGSFPNSMGSFGSRITLLSDIDNDGIREILACNPVGSINNKGEAYILFLNSTGFVKKFIRIDSNFLPLINNEYFGFSTANIGDIDHNGVDDVAISSNLNSDGGAYSGIIYLIKLNVDGTPKSYSKISSTSGNFHGNIGSPPNSAFFATSIASIGDLNKDGNIDIVASSSNPSERAIWILFLDSITNVISYQKIGNDSGQYTDTIKSYENFGIEIKNGGDIDGDGYTDIAVSSTRDSVDGLQTGRVRILFLDSNGIVKSIKRIDNNATNFTNVLQDDDNFGSGLSGVFDYNGDFKTDLLVGAFRTDDGGVDKGAIYLLSIDGTVHPTPPKALWRVNATTGNQNTVFNFTQYSTGFPSSYKWSFTPNTVAYQNGTTDASANPVVKFTQSANYTVQLMVTNPFSSDSLLRSNYINIQTTGLFTPDAAHAQIEMYPNPTNGSVTIQSPVAIQQIWVYDITGKQLLLQQPDAKQDELNLSELKSGIYFIQIQTLQGVQMHKITKQ